MSVILRRGWRVFTVVVLVNAAIQALTTLPFVTPGGALPFVLLAVVSAASLVVGLALVVAQAQAAAVGTRLRVPGRLWAAASVSVLGSGALGALALPSLLLSVPLVFVLLPGIAAGRPLAGFRAFGTSLVRSVLLAVLSIVIVALLWVVALLLGFLITGSVSAALTWLAFGVAAVLITCAWTVRARGSAT